MRATPTPSARRTLRVGLLLIAAAAAAILWLARDVLLLGLLAVLLAVVFSFPVGWLQRLVPRGVAVVLVLVLVAGTATGLAVLAAPTLSRQVVQLTESGPRALRDARRWLARVEQRSSGHPPARTQPPALEQQAPAVISAGASALMDAVSGVTAVLLVIVLAAFLVHRPDLYQRGLRRLVPPTQEPIFDEAWSRLGNGLRHWVGGILVSMAIMGTVTALGLLAIGIEDWLLLGCLTFLGTFVPYLGAIASAIPGLLAALSQSPHHLLLALGVYAGVHVVEGYLVEPLVMRRAVEVKPAMLLFGQGLFGAVFGLLGVVVATPLIVCGQILVDQLWVERRLGKPPAVTEG